MADRVSAFFIGVGLVCGFLGCPVSLYLQVKDLRAQLVDASIELHHARSEVVALEARHDWCRQLLDVCNDTTDAAINGWAACRRAR